LEEAHPAMKDLALIGMTVRMGSGLPAKVAVLGPMRMQYERVMAAVLQTCRAFERRSVLAESEVLDPLTRFANLLIVDMRSPIRIFPSYP
jgi:hypothetical protein